MEIQEFLKQVVRESSANFFILAPDNLGLVSLLQGVLMGVANAEDIHFKPAVSLVKEQVLQLEREAHMAPRGSSEKTHYFIYALREIPPDSVGTLLKAVEEAKYARFIFQTQVMQRNLRTIRSRCQVVQLPFLSKRLVLGNMKFKEHDAQTADRLDLYDGTLDGTIRALGTKDTIGKIKRELTKGTRGLINLLSEEVINSMVFKQVLWEQMTADERAYLNRWDTPSRRQLVAFLISRRQK